MYATQTIIRLLAAGSTLAAALVIPEAAPETQLEERQTTNWINTCGIAAPADFNAFDLGGCNFQLTLTRDRGMVGDQFEFEAVYADGSRQKFTPYRDTKNFAVSDTFYSVDLGNNWITRSSDSKRFTSVHEFSSVCRNNAAPVGWVIIVASKSTSCGRPQGYVWTSQQFGVRSGTRPGNTRPSARRINSAGDYEITWSPVTGAAAYTVLFKVPTSVDDLGNPYTRVIGSRVQAGTTRAVHQGVVSLRWEGRSRQVAVNVVNAQGVWNLARDSPTVEAPW